MLALYRSGRQADAVAAAAQLRRSLADEPGLDPSPEVRERRILQQDPGLRIPSVARAAASGRAAVHVAFSEAAPADTSAVQVLVGRDDVSAAVANAVRLAVEGQGRLLSWRPRRARARQRSCTSWRT
jgi:DNA-binding SARP family transcriptional activator